MSTSHVPAFDSTLNITHQWLRELTSEAGLHDQSQAYSVLRAVLHALRDRLVIAEAVDLGAQLPMLVRGFYYEGWKPSAVPTKQRTQQAFLEGIAQQLIAIESVDAKQATEAVFRLLDRHISQGEIEDIRNVLPHEIRNLWPDAASRL